MAAQQFPSRVYFVLAPKVNRVKIGFSCWVRHRMETFQTGSPERLVLLATIEGSEELERALHRRFRKSRVFREWFEFSSDIVKLVERISRKSVKARKVAADWKRQ